MEIQNKILVALKTQTKQIELIDKEGGTFTLNLEPNIKRLFVKGSLKTSKQVEQICDIEAGKIFKQLEQLKMY